MLKFNCIHWNPNHHLIELIFFSNFLKSNQNYLIIIRTINSKNQNKMEIYERSRIYISFYHDGFSIPELPGYDMNRLKDFLLCLWSRFGTVVDTSYHGTFLFAYVTYLNRQQAEFALSILNNPIKLEAIINDLIENSVNKWEYNKIKIHMGLPTLYAAMASPNPKCKL
jgi:hypothetical protein